MKKAVEVTVIVLVLIGLLFACNYAWDNDPDFQLSKSWNGRAQ